MVGLPIGIDGDSDIVAAPRASGHSALQTDVVEDGGGLGEATATSILLSRQDARGGDEESDLHCDQQPGQVSRADPSGSSVTLSQSGPVSRSSTLVWSKKRCMSGGSFRRISSHT